MKLQGAVIAVTGGASGLGESTVELCVSNGAKVAATWHQSVLASAEGARQIL